MAWTTPKTNWTANDVYNYGDLNRVENNVSEIASFLQAIQYLVPPLTIVKNRDKTSIDFLNSINRVEGNIEQLKNVFVTPPGYQNRKIWAVGIGFGFRDANRLENNLSLLYEWAIKAKENQVFCGTFACGAEWEGVIY